MYIDVSGAHSGIFGTEHIIFMIAVAVIIISFNLIMKKCIKEEKEKVLFLKLCASALFVAICWNRIAIAYKDIVYSGGSLVTLIPSSFCGLSSFMVAISVLFFKKDNMLLHCFGYLGLYGGILSTVYPDYLNSQLFFDTRSITGLIHHALMILVITLAINCGFFKPSVKKFRYFPLGLCCVMTFGVFLMDCLGVSSTMQIHEPLLANLPILTSWYVILPLEVLSAFVFALIYEKTKNKGKK